MYVILYRHKNTTEIGKKKLGSSIYFEAELKTTLLSWESEFDFFYLP